MVKIKYVSLVLFVALLLLTQGVSVAFAEEPTGTPTPTQSGPTPTPDNSSQINNLNNQIKDYQNKIADLQTQEKTFSSQIQIMDSQIHLTELRIDAAREKIATLEKDVITAKKQIVNLEKNINTSTKLLMGRIAATYQVGKINPWQVFLTSSNISNFLTRLTYLKIVQISDKKNLYAAEQSKVDYANEKNKLESKQAEEVAAQKQLEDYTAQLDQDKAAKQTLLDQTRGSEANYQKLLAQAQAEYQSIVGIIAGKGTESELRQVNQGDVIATIINSASCNSSGPHLHFTVSRDGAAQNPFNYLKSTEYSNESNGDPFNPSGSWEWPIDTPIQFNQGYGSDTWYVRTYHFYPSHNGIDISSSSLSVKAVKPGTLFRGSYTGYKGCTLPYVRVHQNDDGLDTFYLHVYST